MPCASTTRRTGAHPLHHEAAEDLKIPESAYNAWRITSLSTLPPWVLALAVTAAGYRGVALLRGFRFDPAGARRVALLGFRLAAALLVLVLLLEPGIELRAESRVRARVALLFDTSRSMKFPAGPSGPSRAEELAPLGRAAQSDLAQLASRFQVDGVRLRQGAAARRSGQASRRPAGASTDILAALGAAASGGSGGRPLAGLFVRQRRRRTTPSSRRESRRGRLRSCGGSTRRCSPCRWERRR